jgi:hypothetical protein
MDDQNSQLRRIVGRKEARKEKKYELNLRRRGSISIWLLKNIKK